MVVAAINCQEKTTSCFLDLKIHGGHGGHKTTPDPSQFLWNVFLLFVNSAGNFESW